MRITNVQIKKAEQGDMKLRGFATVVVDDSIAIHDIRIIEGDKGFFVAMPSRKSNDGVYRDVVHPINQITREMFEKAIIEKYNEE